MRAHPALQLILEGNILVTLSTLRSPTLQHCDPALVASDVNFGGH